MEFLNNITLSLLLSSLLFTIIPPTHSQTITSTTSPIQLSSATQTLATIPPNYNNNSQPFVTSPSGNFVAALTRCQTPSGSFCYVQVDEGETGNGVWTSECVKVSDTNPCSLVLSENGLEVLDGSSTAVAWGIGVVGDNEGVPVAELELGDDGELKVYDGNGEVDWKASDNLQGNTDCLAQDLPLSTLPPPPADAPLPPAEPTLATPPPPANALLPPVVPLSPPTDDQPPPVEPLSPPPFSTPVANATSLPFGQAGIGTGFQEQKPLGPSNQQQAQQTNGFGNPQSYYGQQRQAAGFLSYNNGNAIGTGGWFKLFMGIVLSFVVYGFK